MTILNANVDEIRTTLFICLRMQRVVIVYGYIIDKLTCYEDIVEKFNECIMIRFADFLKIEISRILCAFDNFKNCI